MKKLIVGIIALSSINAFAVEHCSQTWKSDGRIYVDAADRTTDIEVFVPAHASKAALKFSKSNKSPVICLKGTAVQAGSKYIFIATDVGNGI